MRFRIVETKGYRTSRVGRTATDHRSFAVLDTGYLFRNMGEFGSEDFAKGKGSRKRNGIDGARVKAAALAAQLEAECA